MKIPNMSQVETVRAISLARIVSEDSQRIISGMTRADKSSKDS